MRRGKEETKMMEFKIDVQNDTAAVTTPYSKEFVNKLRRMGGAWNGSVWTVNVDIVESVREAMQECFRRDDRPCDTVDVEVTAVTAVADCGTLFGIPVLQGTGRDSGAWIPKGMGDTVSIIAGAVGTSGSIKNWYIEAEKGTKILIRNVPKRAVEERFDCPESCFDIEIVKEHKADPRTALLEEKAALEKRLAEIKALLEAK